MPTNLINIDCMEYMKDCADNAFNLAIVDPPYGININESIGRRKGDKHSGHKKAYWDSKIPTAEYFAELRRISTNQIVWGGNYMTEHLPPSPCWLMWDKGFSELVTFAQFEMAWTSFKSSAKKFDRHPGQFDKIHPTQKPVALYKWILKKYAEKGQRIIDTHLGSGSSAVAAHYFGCDFVGLEIDKDYFAAAQARVAHDTRQIAMF